MGTRTSRVRAIAAAATAAALAVTAAMTAAAPAEAASVKTVKVRMTDTAITFSGGGATTANGVTTLRAGRYHFHVVAPSGGHALQLVRFRNGYTPEQAMQDFQPAFEGDVPAVQRLDHGVEFRGGASARPHHPGDMYVSLRAAQFMAIDQNGTAGALLQVTGTPPNQPRVPHTGKYTAFSYGWGVSKHLPASGTVKIANQADQPHFLVLQRVKASTTKSKVRRFIKSGAQGNPSWALRASADSGVLSRGHAQLLTYDLPPGKYFVACFWPDYFNGMPHFMMGMWTLVTLS
jgi:hypothetical protein